MTPRKGKRFRTSEGSEPAASFTLQHGHAAGVDVHSDNHFVAVPPGNVPAGFVNPDAQLPPAVRKFGANTGDLEALAAWLKQKCVGHLLKDLSELNASKTRGAVRFARDVTAVLRAALTWRDRKPTLPPADFAAQAAQLEAQLDGLIAARRQLTDADNARLAKRLRKHREHLLRFLYVDGLDATNNQAERMLRPAVITRKTGGCNRTEGGAETHSILASVLTTCRQQGFSILDSLVKIQRGVGSTLNSLAPPRLDTS